MSYEQRKTNRAKREKRYKIIMVAFSFIVIIVFLLAMFNKKVKTVMAEKSIYLKELELQSVVIKDEKVYKLSDTKNIDPFILEGKKVPIGKKVGKSILVNDLTLLKKELKDIEDAISILENTDNEDPLKNDKDKMVVDYDNLIQTLQENINIGNYKKIEELKKQIIYIDKKNKDLMPRNNLLDQNTESLEYKKEVIQEEINGTNISETTKVSGILSYKVDGYENVFNPKEFTKYSYDKISLADEKVESNGEVKISNKMDSFKIIDNFEWYLALKVEDRRDIDDYEIGDTLSINYPLKDGNLELKGSIIAINNNSNKSVIILKFNKHLYEIYNARFPKVKLVQEKVEGLRIPKNVIIERNDEKGVYIKDFSGIVKYRPIKIISNEGEFSYIDKGNENLLISLDNRDEDVRTLSIYDEVILKPNRFKENQILD